MAPLPESSTDRYFLDYSVNTVGHTMLCRTDPSVTDEDVISAFDAILTAAAAHSTTISVDGLRFALEGSNVTNPVAWTGDAEYGSGSPNRDLAPYFASFTGRATTGRRARLDIFGWVQTPGPDWRIQSADDSSVTTIVDLLNNSTDGLFLAIDGGAPAWHEYANMSVSDYWVRQLRSS